MKGFGGGAGAELKSAESLQQAALIGLAGKPKLHLAMLISTQAIMTDGTGMPASPPRPLRWRNQMSLVVFGHVKILLCHQQIWKADIPSHELFFTFLS